MENLYPSSIITDDEHPPIIYTITRAEIALIQSSLNYDISMSCYDQERERLLRRVIIKLDQ